MSLYQPLPSSTHIRVLKFLDSGKDDPISLEMFNYDLEKPNCSYSALSYVWGSPDDPINIKCNGQLIKVGKNLHYFLSRSRRDRILAGTILWVDALCIDQSNDMEKEQQIPMMGTIYRRAVEVLIELGNCDQAVEDLVIRIQNDSMDPALAAYADQRALGAPKDSSILIPTYSADEQQSLIKLVDLPWFTRVWTLQELILANRPSIMLGKCRGVHPLPLFRSIILYLRDSTWAQGSNALVNESFKTFLLPKYTRLLTEAKYVFHNDFNDARGLSSTEEIDHVYGILGISQQVSSKGPFKIDTKESYEQTMLRMSRELVENGHMDWVLWNARGAPSKPSWIATVSKAGVRRETHDYRCACERRVKTMSTTVDNKNQLLLRGYIISKLKEVSNVEQKYSLLEFIAEGVRDQQQAFDNMKSAIQRYMNGLATWFNQLSGVDKLDVKQQISFACSLSMSSDVTEAEKVLNELKSAFGPLLFTAYGGKMAGRQLAILGETAPDDNKCCNVPNGSQKGDILVVIPGVYWPFILRPAGNCFAVVGPAYVPALMEGMALREDFPWSSSDLQDLILV